MERIKEKNLIKVIVKGKKKPYILDINSGIVYGLSGKPVKSVPRDIFDMFCPTAIKTEVGRVVSSACRPSTLHRLVEGVEILKLADSFDSLGISICEREYYYYHYYAWYASLIEDKKAIKEYIKYALKHKENNEQYDYIEFERYYSEIQMFEFYKKMGYDLNEITDLQNMKRYLEQLMSWATKREVKSYFVNFIDTGYYRVDNSYTYFQKYCKWCRYLNEKVTTKPNFIIECGRVCKAYLAQKETIDKEQFQKSMNIHRKEMEFEYGDFKVVIPNTPQEIKDEGLNMHHCVASYALSCLDTTNPKRSYIVFIRHKDTPEKCYITCEIRNGKICQYFLSHDRRISNQEDIEFKTQYQVHLNKTWVKE